MGIFVPFPKELDIVNFRRWKALQWVGKPTQGLVCTWLKGGIEAFDSSVVAWTAGESVPSCVLFNVIEQRTCAMWEVTAICSAHVQMPCVDALTHVNVITSL